MAESGPIVNGSFLLNQLRAVASLADGFTRESLSLPPAFLSPSFVLSKKLFHSHLISTIVIICTLFFRLVVQNKTNRAKENVEKFHLDRAASGYVAKVMFSSEVNLGIYTVTSFRARFSFSCFRTRACASAHAHATDPERKAPQ